MTTVLIVGGYGAVGSDLCRILSTDSDIDLVVAGRDGEKASRLASELDAKSRVVDVDDPDSSAAGLEGIDLVVNCFVDVVEPSLNLPMAAIARGIYYLDLAAVPVEYVKSF
ncbi:MAG: NAD(P)H-binding protein, partial [bacterium]|nr:NAD(P)H-binding protein [bacterium]